MWGISRTDMSVPLFIMASAGALFMCGLGFVSYGYYPHLTLGNACAVLMFPLCLLGYLQKKWASLPLWIVVTLMLVDGAFRETLKSSAKDLAFIFAITFVLEIARIIRGFKTKNTEPADLLTR
ncbi:hypothetical protein SAMN05444167_0079 [Terriglobus roseus]|uniref:Uncharacterized protein n=1 Tax=Terriglobus roseus TaxID=392734 RepID=A0A1G7ESD5_9BACT|nr:hypothetical protein SAMN05444167_0079 [Terriglobus roseus]